MQSIKKTYIFFCTFSLIAVTIIAVAYSDNTLLLLDFLWQEPFLLFIRIVCAVLFCFLILKWINQKLLPRGWFKFIVGIIFLPVLILPIFRCYFKVPYVFCRACPDKCPWGLSRTFFFSSFVALNLSGRFWCTTFCPFGTFQECQAKISKEHLRPFFWLAAIPYVILALVAAMYSLTFFGISWVEYFAKGVYLWAGVSAFIAALIIALAFFVRRFWCNYFCPIGTIGVLSFKFKRLLRNIRQKQSQNT